MRAILLLLFCTVHIANTQKQNLTQSEEEKMKDLSIGSPLREFITSQIKAKNELQETNQRLQGSIQEYELYAPYYKFRCAIESMKQDITDYYRDNIAPFFAAINSKTIPVRINNIIEINDMFLVKGVEAFQKRDLYESYNRWYLFVTTPSNTTNLTKPMEARAHLQGNLTDYYSKLDPIEKEKYTSEDDFLQCFAAIMARSYRYADYFRYILFRQMKKAYKDEKSLTGTELSLTEALCKVIPRYYFDHEHIKMLNIFRKAANLPNEFHSSANFSNELGEAVTLPGLNSCYHHYRK